MGISGRYDFKGIQKAIGTLVDGFLASTSWGAWILASAFKPVITAAENLLINYLTNRGLVILNLGDILVNGSVDQTKLDSAIDDALKKLQIGHDKITPAEGAEIDAEVVKAFDESADLGAPAGVQNVSGPSI